MSNLQQWHVLEEALSGGAVSTVSNGSDNGANDCISRELDGSQRHGTTKKAIENIITDLPKLTGKESKDEESLQGTGLAIIGAHGSPGYFETGSGQGGDYDEKWDVATWNQDAWEAHFKELKGEKFKILRLSLIHI